MAWESGFINFGCSSDCADSSTHRVAQIIGWHGSGGGKGRTLIFLPGRYQKNLYIHIDRGNDSDSGSGKTSAATGDNDGSASSKSQTSLNSSKDANEDPNLSTSLEEDDDDVSLPMTEDASHNLEK